MLLSVDEEQVLRRSINSKLRQARCDALRPCPTLPLPQPSVQVLQRSMDGKLDTMLSMLTAQFQMLSDLLKGVGKLAPKLVCFLPCDILTSRERGTRWWKKAFSPRDWLNTWAGDEISTHPPSHPSHHGSTPRASILAAVCYGGLSFPALIQAARC